MKPLDWVAHAALAELASGGAAVLAADPMDLPLIALRPRTAVATWRSTTVLERAEGGVIARRLGAGVQAAGAWSADTLGFAVDRAGQGAADFARCFGRPPDVVIGRDGASFAPGTGEAPAQAFDEALHRARRMDPLTLLRTAAGRLPAVRGVGVTEAANAVVWFEPLACLRGLGAGGAHRMAMRGSVDLWMWRTVTLGLPVLGIGAPRWRLEFEDSVEPRTLEVGGAAAASVGRIDANVVEVGGDGVGGAMSAELQVRGHRAPLAGVGLVVPMPVADGDAVFADPLAQHADPLAGYPAGRAP